ncbi:uncharacterized protein CTRU02_210264 [Colletotrichum truncatum]|uniref:Uncharacterized protein n=1 Tax=Colletotrichum truncatum TaxID=5467 RepID=A0ACC3YUP6_COLTU
MAPIRVYRMTDSIGPEHQQLLYEPIVLEQALQEVPRRRGNVAPEELEDEYTTLTSNEQAFRCLLNRVAEVCENRDGGETDTSITVFETDEGPLFMFGSKQRSADDLKETEDFIKDLLNIAANTPGIINQKAVTREILRRVLRFNTTRLKRYLKRLGFYLNECVEDPEVRLPEGQYVPF